MESRKIENCFADSRTYEYRLPMTVSEFSRLLSEEEGDAWTAGWKMRCNQKIRRPVFLAEKGRLQMKGILAGDLLRIGFPEEGWEQAKEEWEAFAEKLFGEKAGER